MITLFRKTNMKLCSSHKTWYHIYQILRYQIYQILISLPSGFCQWRNMSIMFLDAVCQFKISTNVPALDMYKTPAMDLNSHQPGSAKKSAGSIHDRYLACKVKTSKKHLCFNQLQDKRRYPETFALSLMSIALFCHNASKLRSTIKYVGNLPTHWYSNNVQKIRELLIHWWHHAKSILYNSTGYSLCSLSFKGNK